MHDLLLLTYISQFCGTLCQLSLAWKLAKVTTKLCQLKTCSNTVLKTLLIHQSVCFQRKNLVKSPQGNMAFHLPFCYKVAQRVEVGVKYWSKYYRIRYPFQILRLLRKMKLRKVFFYEIVIWMRGKLLCCLSVTMCQIWNEFQNFFVNIAVCFDLLIVDFYLRVKMMIKLYNI